MQRLALTVFLCGCLDGTHAAKAAPRPEPSPPVQTVTAVPAPPQPRKPHVIVSDGLQLLPTSAQRRPPTACVDLSTQREPRRIRSLKGRCVIVKGFWGVGAVLIPESRDGGAGFHVLRPFSFVRERNPSSGWPSWFALDAILVDEGWIPAGDATSLQSRDAYRDPMFEEPVTVRGVVREVRGEGMSRLWDPLTKLGEDLGAAPYGNELLPIVLQGSG